MLITICCFLSVLVLAGLMKKFDKGGLITYCDVFFGVLMMLMLITGIISFSTGDFYTDVEKTDIIIVDKWCEDSKYFFACEDGNIYRMDHRQDYMWTLQNRYNNSLYNRHKNLVADKKYTITFFYPLIGIKRNSLSEVRKDMN